MDVPNLRVSSMIKVDGGVSHNNFVNQFIANMSGRKIVRYQHPGQTTALGAAFLAGLGAGMIRQDKQNKQNFRWSSQFFLPPTGIWKSKKELKWLRTAMQQYVPQFDEQTRQARYAVWKRAVERSLGWEQHDGRPDANLNGQPVQTSEKQAEML